MERPRLRGDWTRRVTGVLLSGIAVTAGVLLYFVMTIVFPNEAWADTALLELARVLGPEV